MNGTLPLNDETVREWAPLVPVISLPWLRNRRYFQETLLFHWAFLFVVITTWSDPPKASVKEAWVRRYGITVPSQDHAISILSDHDGNAIVTGTTYDGATGADILTIKYSAANGSVLWKRRYDGPAHHDDLPTGMALDALGNVVITGTSADHASGQDFYTAKYASDTGTLLWDERYAGPGNGFEGPKAVAVDPEGNVVVTGYSQNGKSIDCLTIKYAGANGALLWKQQFVGNSPSAGRAVATDRLGNVVVGGYFQNQVNDKDFLVVKYAADGKLLWKKQYGGPANLIDSAVAVVVDSNANVIVTGYSAPDLTRGLYHLDFYTAKYSGSDGTLLWENRYDGGPESIDSVQGVAVDSKDNVVVAGYSSQDVRPEYNVDYYVAKYSGMSGALLWEQRYSRAGLFSRHEARALAIDRSDNVIVTGASGVDHNDDFYTAKYASNDGTLLWERRYDSPIHGTDQAEAMALDPFGNVLVTGHSNVAYHTAKYAALDGKVQWEHGSNESAKGSGQAAAAALDDQGNVFVAGSIQSATNGTDCYTAKYSGSEGRLLWDKHYNGLANRDDAAHTLTIDRSGSVIIAGSSGGGPPAFSQDLCLVKYASADGTLLWETRSTNVLVEAMVIDRLDNIFVTGFSYYGSFIIAKFSGKDGAPLWKGRLQGQGPAIGRSIAVDATGNVVVAGFTDGFGIPVRFLAKYASSDGTLIWEHSNVHSPHFTSAFNEVAVDHADNVVATGNSARNPYTAKFAGANGTLIWEMSYTVPSETDGEGRSVAVDSRGDVLVAGTAGGNYYTAKFAAENGRLLWERPDDGPANPPGSAVAIMLDKAGNAVVTGSSNSGKNGANDFYTAKYSALDGSLLWEKRYNGPADGDDSVRGPQSLALGANGMIVVAGGSDGDSGSFERSDFTTVLYRETLPPIFIQIVRRGILLGFTGRPGQLYNIDRSTMVTGPWQTVATRSAPANGLIEHFDDYRPLSSIFYRVSTP